MANLIPIPNVTRLSERIIRVLGQNPGKFTLQGTNTYLVGRSNPYILVDTAEGKEEFVPVLESALLSEARPTNAALPDVSDIILSHWHHDHIGGLPAILSLLQKLWKQRNPSTPFIPPRLHKYPLETSTLNKNELTSWYTVPQVLESLPAGSYTPTPSGPILHDLHDKQILRGTDATLRVLHTPGHTLDSISLFIEEDRVLYTADTVLGQGTSIFDDLGLYIGSLNSMLKFLNELPSETRQQPDDEIVLYPSHGPIVAKGKETIAMYISHRLERENQVLGLLSRSALSDAPTSAVSTWDIVTTLYAAYPENLWLPAMRGIELHLKKLLAEKRVEKAGGEGKDARWKLAASTLTPGVDVATLESTTTV